MVLAAVTVGSLASTEAHAEGIWVSAGYIGSLVGGETTAAGHGVELSSMYTASSRDSVGFGLFGQAQHYSGSPGHGRYALGVQAWGLVGLELGWAYRSGNGVNGATSGLHVGPYVSIGLLYAGFRITVPVAHEAAAPGYGYEAAVTLGIKLPFPLGDPAPNLNFGHGRPLVVHGSARVADVVFRADWS